MNKYIKYGLLLAVVALLAYKSVYFEKLSTRKSKVVVAFNAKEFSTKLWQDKMPAKIDSAIELTVLIREIAAAPADAFNKHTNALAIGNCRYALVKLEATVVDVKEDEVQLQVKHNDSLLTVNLATEFIYGNAIRDASGLLQVNDFPNTRYLNAISERFKKIVRSTVLPPFKTAVKKGDTIQVVAAFEFNKEHIQWQGIELLPVKLQIVQ